MTYVFLKSDKAGPKEGESPIAVMHFEATDTDRINRHKEHGWSEATIEEYLADNPDTKVVDAINNDQ